MDTGLLLGLAIGAVVGVLAGWLLASSRLRAADLEAARARATLEAERHGAQARLADSDRLADQFRALAADALATSTVPKSGCSSPVAIESVVVLPAPLGPTRP